MKVGQLMLHSKAVSWWKVLDVTIIVISVLMVIYHLINTQHQLFQPLAHANIHLLFAFTITFLAVLRKNRKHWPLILVLVLLGLTSTGYVGIFFEDLISRSLFNTTLDLVIGIILIVLCLEATRRSFGLLLPVLTILIILYCFFGYLLPGIFKVTPMGWQEVVSRLSLALGWGGIYGSILDISATYVFLFMIFAEMITTVGAIGFFNELGKIVGRKVRAGPAMAAVITSSMVGSVSGSSGANVMVTGSFTIPAMKKVGYSAEQSGAIEAAASTAGPIIPPVMGVVAFLLAGFTGISYAYVCLIAIIPALLYIISAAFYAYFQAEKMGVARWTEALDLRELIIRAPLFLVPLLVIVGLFLMNHSAMYVSFWAVISICIMGMIRKKTRPTLSGFVRGIANGAELGSQIAVVCALLGIIVTTVTMSGVGVKFPMAVAGLVDNNIILLLLLTAVISIVLGTGLPASAAYVLVAITIVPTLVQLGVPLLAAHLFAFYFANFSFITPPVGISCIFAARLAGGNYLKTSIQAVMVGMAGFILPFIIVFSPAFMFDFSDPLFAITSLIACPIIFFALQSAVVGYMFKNLKILERVLLILSPAALMVFIYNASYLFLIAGVGILAGFIIWQIRMKIKGKQSPVIEKVTG
jgi:TRAP transporter 4TM/12TM fusion protein